MLARLREGGEVRSAEFARADGRAGGWWEWKPEKRALEHLFAAGELMISRRDPNFHRVYDLREHVLKRALPGWEDALAPTYEETQRRLALGAVRAEVVQPNWKSVLPRSTSAFSLASQPASTTSATRAPATAPRRAVADRRRLRKGALSTPGILSVRVLRAAGPRPAPDGPGCRPPSSSPGRRG